MCFLWGKTIANNSFHECKKLFRILTKHRSQYLKSCQESIHCLVFAFSDRERRFEYTKAIALIRSEHPDLMQKSCIHEELAQGLGLANDSPHARPSIFNDDDEFATLTRQDELFLKCYTTPNCSRV